MSSSRPALWQCISRSVFAVVGSDGIRFGCVFDDVFNWTVWYVYVFRTSAHTIEVDTMCYAENEELAGWLLLRLLLLLSSVCIDGEVKICEMHCCHFKKKKVQPTNNNNEKIHAHTEWEEHGNMSERTIHVSIRKCCCFLYVNLTVFLSVAAHSFPSQIQSGGRSLGTHKYNGGKRKRDRMSPMTIVWKWLILEYYDIFTLFSDSANSLEFIPSVSIRTQFLHSTHTISTCIHTHTHRAQGNLFFYETIRIVMKVMK